MVRKHIIFSGQVQGVGFRWQACRRARGMGLTGWVRNLPDGRVEMEVQGAPNTVGRLLADLNTDPYIRISHMDMRELPVSEEESGFHVRY